jgi:uncharacterized membrane protein
LVALVVTSASLGPGLDLAVSGVTAPAGGLVLLVAIGGLILTALIKMRVPLFLTAPLLAMAAFGTFLNLPVYHMDYQMPRTFSAFGIGSWTETRPAQTILAVNVGGALVPLLLASLLLLRAPFGRTALATGAVAAVAFTQAVVAPSQGVLVSVFVVPIVAVAVAFALDRRQAASVAYVAGVAGTFIGADLLNLPRLLTIGAPVLSLGGAGIFDAVFVVGVIAASLSPRTEESSRAVRASALSEPTQAALRPRTTFARLPSPTWSLW